MTKANPTKVATMFPVTTDIGNKKILKSCRRIGIKSIADLFEQPSVSSASRVSNLSAFQIMSELRG